MSQYSNLQRVAYFFLCVMVTYSSGCKAKLGLVPKREQSQRVGGLITLIFRHMVVPGCHMVTAAFTRTHVHLQKKIKRPKKERKSYIT